MSGINTFMDGWCAIGAAASEIGEEEEEYEIDELMDEDEVSTPIPSDPAISGNATRAPARPARLTPNSTTTNDTASNDEQAAPTAREHQKRPRHDSASDSEDDEDARRVRLRRSRAPSPPSLPPSPNEQSAGDFDDPCPITPHERAIASRRKASFAIVDREHLERTLLQLLAAAGINARGDVGGGLEIVNGSGASKERARSASYGSDSFIDDESDTLSTGRAPSDDDNTPEHNAQHSAMVARSLGARYRMGPSAPVAEAYGNKPRGLKKPKFPPKPRAETTPPTADSSVPPSERAPSNASPAGTADHLIVDASTDEEQASEWAALVRSFVKGKGTRVRDHGALLNALIAAGGADLSARVLVDSGLYLAVRALGEQTLAGEMFAAVDAAKELAKRWEGQFGAALEEDV